MKKKKELFHSFLRIKPFQNVKMFKCFFPCLCPNLHRSYLSLNLSFLGGGGGVAQSVERATSGEEVLGSIPVVATHRLGRCQYNVTG